MKELKNEHIGQWFTYLEKGSNKERGNKLFRY